MDRRERQFVVLHRVDLAVENLRREIIAARHRQAGIVQTETEVVRQFETVAAGAHHQRACLVTGLVGFHQEAAVLDPDMRNVLVVTHIDTLAGDGLRLAHEGTRQGLEVDRGVFIGRSQRDDLLAADSAVATGDHRRLDFCDVFLFQQAQFRVVMPEHLETLAQQAALAFAHGQHHFRVLVDQVVLVRLAQAVIGQHARGALHLERFFQRVIGLDVAAVQGLAVVAGQRVDARRRGVFLDHGDTPDIGEPRHFVEQRGAGNAGTDNHQFVLPGTHQRTTRGGTRQRLVIDRGFKGAATSGPVRFSADRR